MVIVMRSPAVPESSVLLRGAALPPEDEPLPERESCRTAVGQLLLDESRQCQIDVVPAEQQVFANRDPLESKLSPRGCRPHQAEVGRPASHVAHQHQRVVREPGRRFAAVRRDPRIEGGDRLFEEDHPIETGVAGRLHRQLPRLFVEGRGHGQDDRLMLESKNVAC